MAQTPNPRDKYYCEFCGQHFRVVYNLYRHKCIKRDFIEDKKLSLENGGKYLNTTNTTNIYG